MIQRKLSEAEQESYKRRRLACWAWAYMVDSDPLVSDSEFFTECAKINLDVDTADPVLDMWWRENFIRNSAGWILTYPDKPHIERLTKNVFRKLYKNQKKG